MRLKLAEVWAHSKDFKMKKVLIVGGAGYIGGYLTDILQNEYHVTVYDNLTYEERFLKRVDFVRGDIRDTRKLLPLIRHSDVVVWLAAIVGDGACAVNPLLTKEVNLNTVDWLVEQNVGKIIFASTCSVYGKNDDILTEESPTNPLSLYAETKLAAEKLVLQWDNTLAFRLGTLYGIGDEHSRVRLDLVANALTYKAMKGETLKVFGGDQWRPILHVKDVASAIRFGIENDLAGLYNLVDENCTILDIARRISYVIPNTHMECSDIPFEDFRNYKVCNWKIKKTGWRPNLSLYDGIGEFYHLFGQGRIKNPENPVYSNVAYLRSLINERKCCCN
jgi:nucleoside-diphosphate-sugar epimerase